MPRLALTAVTGAFVSSGSRLASSSNEYFTRRRKNVERRDNYCSDWFQREAKDAFLSIVEVGDRLEFNRGTISHFAIYSGEGYMKEEKTFCRNCVVHSMDTGTRMDLLEKVWEDSPCRVNNLLDEKHKPFDPPEIKKRALDMVEGRESWGTYNLATNNCEHFASWLRNGVKSSNQVLDAGKE